MTYRKGFNQKSAFGILDQDTSSVFANISFSETNEGKLKIDTLRLKSTNEYINGVILNSNDVSELQFVKAFCPIVYVELIFAN